jgi:hypothetical protein
MPRAHFAIGAFVAFVVACTVGAIGASTAACSSSSNVAAGGELDATASVDAAPPPANDAADAGTDDAADAQSATCSLTEPITLWVEDTDGYPTRIHVPASIGAKNGSFLFDTGSETTFVATPAGTPDQGADGGAATIGTCTRSYVGRPYHSEDAHGLPNLGTYGADQVFAAQDSRFDLEAGVLERFLTADPVLGSPGWSSTPLERVMGSLLVRVKLDGVAVRLLIDTGSPDILWLGQQMKPGDVESQTLDAAGNVLTFYKGQVMAEISPGRTEPLPVSRFPSFPYFEQRVQSEFGGDVQGLLGVAALGSHFAFDTTKMVLLRKP